MKGHTAKKKPLRAKKHVPQTGGSRRTADTLRKAKAPGQRRSKSGGTYFERRKNRSDKRETRV